MVVFIDGEPAKKEYRHYRIKTVEGANDFASMNEVLGRRFRRAVSEDPNEKWPMPDLVLIDGGPEQLRFARNAMLAAGADVPMFGLAKRLEEIFLPGQEESILLDRKSPALHLIQQIRRRVPPLRHHLSPEPAREGHRPQPAGGHPGHREDQAAGAAAVF